MPLNLHKNKEYLEFLQVLSFLTKFTQVLEVSCHSQTYLPGWQGLKSLYSLDKKNEIYEIDIRHAWGTEIFKQYLIDDYFIHFPTLSKTYKNKVNKLIIYLCEESINIQEKYKLQGSQDFIAFQGWKTVHHVYLSLQELEQFTNLLFLNFPDLSFFNHQGYGTIQCLENLEKHTTFNETQLNLNFMNFDGNVYQKKGGLRTKKITKKYPFEKSLITIITVVFNGEDNLEQTIQSVINQSNHNIEYLIIDGNSTDKTLNIIHKYENEINYWISEADQGVYHAMNKGWEMAHEDSYVLFLGAGDLIVSLPEIEKDSKEIIFGRVIKSETGLFKSTSDFRLKLGNTLHHQALLIHKSLHPSPPFNISYKVYADFDFNSRLLNQGAKFKFSKNFLSYAAPAGISGKHYIVEVLKIVKENHGFFWLILSILYHIYQGFKHGFEKYSTDLK